MSVLLVYVVALAFSLIFGRRVYETIAGSIILESFIIFLSDMLVGSLNPGVYVIYGMTIVGFVICIYYSFHDFSRVKAEVLSAASLAWFGFVCFFALTSVGRGLRDYDDFVVWGLEVKNMYFNGTIYSPLSTSLGYYPPATMCWNYLACKTWFFGYSDSAILWAYNTYIIACILPIFRHVGNRKDVTKFFVLFGFALLLPISLDSFSYGIVYERLCSDVLLGVLSYYGIYIASSLAEKQEIFEVIQICLILYAITLAKRIGFSWTIFPLMVLTYYLIKEINDKSNNAKRFKLSLFLISVHVFPVFISILWDGFQLYAFLPVVTLIFEVMLLNYGKSVWALIKRYYILAVLFMLVLACVFYNVVERISNFPEDTNGITALFFQSVFSNKYGGFGNIVKLPIFAFILASLIIVKRMEKNDVFVSNKALTDVTTLYIIIFAMLINVAILYSTYITLIGLDPYWDGLPAFERYISPYFMIIVIWILEKILINKNKHNTYLISFCIVFLIEIVNVGDLADYVFDKNPQLEYPGLDNSGIELTQDDKVYYVNTNDSRWYVAPFYYYVCPAVSNTEGVIGYDKSSNKVSLTAEAFSEELISEGYTYLYIKNLYDAFTENYSELFYNPDDIHDNSFYKIDIEDGRVCLRQL